MQLDSEYINWLSVLSSALVALSILTMCIICVVKGEDERVVTYSLLIAGCLTILYGLVV